MSVPFSPWVARNIMNQQFPRARGSDAAPTIDDAYHMEQAEKHYNAAYILAVTGDDDAPLTLAQNVATCGVTFNGEDGYQPCPIHGIEQSCNDVIEASIA